jgi:hypothetical protein
MIMANNHRKRKAENLGRRINTLLKKLYELENDFDIDAALILRTNDQFIAYKSIDLESWPPSLEQIVSLCYFTSIAY